MFVLDDKSRTNKKVNNKFDVERLIFNFLNKDNIFEPRKSEAIKYFNKCSQKQSDISSIVFDSLEKITNENPQLVIELIKETFTGEIFTPLIALSQQKDNGIYQKIDFISTFWEVSAYYKFPAYLISNLQVPLPSLKNKQSIFCHFHQLGFDTKMIEEIRLIRNAKNHKFTIKSDSIVYSHNEKLIEISFDRILLVYNNLDDLFSWWSTFLLITVYYLPSFGILFLYAIYIKANNNVDLINDYSKGLKNVFPNIKQAINENRTETLKEKITKIYKNIKYRIVNILYRKNMFQEFLLQNSKYIISRLIYHSANIENHFHEIATKLAYPDDKASFEKMSYWFKNIKHKISSIDNDEFYKAFSERFRV